MRKVDVYLINGFLGSGKTTLLLNLMAFFKSKQKKYAIILNELGNVNMEKHLFEDESLYELLDGCICCSIKEDLRGTLNQITVLVHKENIDVILLEGTGVANPSEIIETFQEPDLATNYQIVESICVIDGLHLTEYTSVFSSSKEVRQLQQEQIENGSLLVLNKVDQLSSMIAIEKVEKKIRKYNKLAPLIHSKYGSGVTGFLDSNHNTKSTQIIDRPAHHHHHQITSIKIEQSKAMTKTELTYFLKEYQSQLLRAKGIIKNKMDQKWYHFQYASGLLEWEILKNQPRRKNGEIILIGVQLRKEEVHM